MQICDLVKLRYDVSCIQEHLLNGCQGLTIPMIVDFSARKALYKEQFKAGENCADYAEFKEKLCLLRDSKLPFRGIDGVKRVMKAQNNCALLLSLNIPELYDKLKRQEFFTEFEKKLISQIPGLEENLVFVEKILWLHGTNSATLTLLPYTGYEMIPTGRLLDRGIAPMSGEIYKEGMRRFGINQGKLSVDTISGIKRCSEYANITSRSFNSFFYTDQEETIFLSRLRELKELSTDDTRWDPTLIELIRLKQWCPEAFEDLVKKYEPEIEALKKAIVEKKCLYECLILKALDFDANVLIQAKNDSELRQKVESEFLPSCLTDWVHRCPKWYDTKDMKWAFNIFDQTYGHNFQECLFNLSYNSQYQMVIIAMFKLKANGEEWLKQLNTDQFDMNLSKRWRYDAAELLKSLIEQFGKNQIGDKIVSHYVRQPIEAQMKKNMRPFERRYQRLLNVFAQPQIKFTDTDRAMIENPFPILMASTKTKSLKNDTECNVLKAKLGSDIDLLFTTSQYVPELQAWSELHQLDITIKDMNLFDSLKEFPLLHSDRQVNSVDPFLSKGDHVAISKLIAKYAPLYRSDYPDGSKRVHHGVPHAVRTYFLALTFAELYKDKGFAIKTEKSHLLLSAFLHDSARQNDGVDLWDKESGEAAQKILIEDLQASPEPAALLMRCIAEKDLKPAFALEQKIIHDADCLEILRCLRNPESFKPDELIAMQDLDQDVIFTLINEAKHFIRMTESPAIKEALPTTADPAAMLFQILWFASDQQGAFPLLSGIHREGIKIFDSSKCLYALNEEVESSIISYTETT